MTAGWVVEVLVVATVEREGLGIGLSFPVLLVDGLAVGVITLDWYEPYEGSDDGEDRHEK